MKGKIASIIALILFLAIACYVPKVEAATGFYYPSETEINYAIDEVKKAYPAGSKFEGSFDGGIECIGFAKYAFNKIWGVDCMDAYTSDAKYKFKLSETSVVDEVGCLTGSSVTASNIKNLFNNTPKGSLVQMCSGGQQHTMLFVSNDSNNIHVLEANIDFNKTVAHSTISYSSLASRCGGSGNGISTYKYNGKKNSAGMTQNYGTYVHIISKIGGKYLTATGNDVVMQSKNDSYSQIWKIERVTDKTSKDYDSMKIISLETGKCLTMANSSSHPADVYLADDQNLKTQKWYMNNMLPDGKNTYMFSTQAARTVLEVPSASNAENVAVIMYQDNRTIAQQFELQTASAGGVLDAEYTDIGDEFIATIKSNDGEKYLTNKSTYTDFEGNISSLSQLWKFTKASDGSYIVKSLLDNKYLAPSGSTNGSSIALSNSVFKWKVNSYSGWYLVATGQSQYKTGYRFIHESRPLIISNNSSSKAVLTSTAYSETGLFKISKENISSISFYSGTDWIKIGETINMSKKVSLSGCSEYFRNLLNWSVSDSTIATVDSNGNLTGKKAGTITLTVSYKYDSTIKATKTINVGTKLESISLSESNVLLDEGQKKKLTVIYNPTDTTQSTTVTWSSSNNSIATVDQNGNITAVSSGSATITAKVGTLRATCTVKVKGANPSNVELEVYSDKNECTPGDVVTIRLRLRTEASNIYKGNFKISFDDSIFELSDVAPSYYYTPFNSSVVTVNQATNYVEFNYNGTDTVQNIVTNNANETFFYIKLRVKSNVNKLGTTQITLTSSGVRQTGGNIINAQCISCSTKVTTKTQSISLSPSSVRMYSDGKKLELEPVITPSTASNNLTWTSSDTSIATVDSNGVVTTRYGKSGTVTITAKTKDGSNLQATCTIIVAKSVNSVSIDQPSYIYLYKKGETYQLTATVYPSDAQNKSLSWISSNKNVARVEGGLVIATGNGECEITVMSDDGSRKSDTITVYVRYAEKLSFAKKSDTIEVGKTNRVVVSAEPSNVSTPPMVFVSSDPSIVEVNKSGLNVVSYTGKKVGTATITVMSPEDLNLVDTFTVTVKEPVQATIPISQVILNKKSVTLETGKTTKLSVTFNPVNTTSSKYITWSTSNSNVATVDSTGLVTAKSSGTAVITAKTVNGKTATCTVTVQKPQVTSIPITGVSLDSTNLTIKVGVRTTLRATITPTNTTNSKSITWLTSNSNVATVDSTGLVTAKASGTAIITAKTSNGKTATCKITVITNQTTPTTIPITKVVISSTTVTIKKGLSTTLKATITPTNTTNSKSITWTTSNSKIATVDSTGKVTAKASGTAVITAKTSNGKLATCKVVVQADSSSQTTNSTKPSDTSTKPGTTNPTAKPTNPSTTNPTKPSTTKAVPNVTYRTHVQNVGWQGYVKNGAMSGTSGKSLRLEGANIKLENNEYGGGISYQTHVQNIGWQNYVQNGAMTGTSGKSLRLEGIRIKLTGEIAKYYDVYYRVHCQNFGWMDWAKNGEDAGSSGYSYRLEGLEIRLVKKGGKAPGKTSKPFIQKYVRYQTHVQNIGWQGAVLDNQASGTSGKSLRLEGIKISLENQKYDGNIEYCTHVQNIGWQNYVKNGAMSGTSGRSLRLEAIKIRLTGTMAQKYDIYYRVHCQNFGWMGWAKNGQSSGSQGFAYRLEAIEICLVEKGQSAPGSTANSFRIAK